MNIYVADFETTTDPDDCRVWGGGLIKLGVKRNFAIFYNSIEKFMEIISRLDTGSIIYFHNLAFDGEFIINHLFRTGFLHTEQKEIGINQFSTLISDMGLMYDIKVNLGGKIITFWDSLKLIPMKVSQMSKAFGLRDVKLEIDYNAPRPVGHILTDEEEEYILADILIVQQSLEIMYKNGLKKMTIGSSAMNIYKNKFVGRFRFDDLYPIDNPKIDHDIRQSYKGGWVYVNPKFQGKALGKGCVYDINSLYPSVMRNKPMPFGHPIQFKGKYVEDEKRPLFVQRFRCFFEIKEGFLPTVQIKNNVKFNAREYVTSSLEEMVVMSLTSVDMKLFLEHYNVFNMEYLGGYKFKQASKLFTEYIDKWNETKVKADKEGNQGLRTIAKLMMNSLYGKFATSNKVLNKIPLYENEQVRYILSEPQEKDTIYVAIASFITAYAREITIRTAQSVFERFIYADTDSIHLLGDEEPNIDIDSSRLGAWKNEGIFTKGKFLRAKSYVEEVDGKLKVTCAGMPNSCYDLVTFENFKIGTNYKGKLQKKRVKGGTVLIETEFTIK